MSNPTKIIANFVWVIALLTNNPVNISPYSVTHGSPDYTLFRLVYNPHVKASKAQAAPDIAVKAELVIFIAV
jgi:hypothetical protein